MSVDEQAKRMARWILLFIAGAAFLIPTLIAAHYVSLWQIYKGYVETASNLTGLNTYLTTAAAALIFIPFSIGASWILSLRSGRRQAGAAILLVLFVLYNLGLFFGTRNIYFGAQGETLKWYAITPDGVQEYDRPGFDRKYDIELKPVTKDVVRQLELMKRGEFKPIDPASAKLFNPHTGEAQTWFHRHADGTLEFYDKPGFYPATGAPLQPVTQTVFFEWKRGQEERAKRKAEAAAAALRDENARRAKALEIAATQAAETRAAEERSIRAQHIASVTILSFPPGAEVLIDRGKYRGTTPFTIALESGSYGLRLTLPGYKSKADVIAVAPPLTELRYTLSPEG